MRWSKSLVPTQKEAPAEAEIPSHALLVRAGFIRQLGAGTYSYLPLGLRALRRAAEIVRQEMDAAGALELLLPALHPLALWEETGRAGLMGPTLFRLKDRHGHENVLGPTHEEVITDLVRREVSSHRQLPLTLYQIQTKFRDEPRPRAGIIRTREFLMKDAYSFDADAAGLEASYRRMYAAYQRLFDRCGLKYVICEAESGAIGGDVNHEFLAPSPSGEDLFAHCAGCGYAANLERAECPPPAESAAPAGAAAPLRREIATPNQRTIADVSAFLGVKPAQLIKTLIFVAGAKPLPGEADRRPAFAVLLRGDHEANSAKVAKLWPGEPVELAEPATIQRVTGAPVGFAGPVGLQGIKIFADHAVRAIADGVTGANTLDAHLVGVVPGRDFTPDEWRDLRLAEAGDRCPRCAGGRLVLERGIEIGHVFKLGTKYSAGMKAVFLDEQGALKPCVMGCYGIGVNRILAAAVEQSHDARGIIWPPALAPFPVHLVTLKPTEPAVAAAAEKLYEALRAAGVEVLYDDRDLSAGVKFNDADLVGLPLRVTVSPKSLAAGKIELKARTAKEFELLPLEGAAEELRKRVAAAAAPGPAGAA